LFASVTGELRAFLAEQAAALRAEMLESLSGVMQPFISAAEAMRAWNPQASGFFDKLSRPGPSPASLKDGLDQDAGDLVADLTTRPLAMDIDMLDAGDDDPSVQPNAASQLSAVNVGGAGSPEPRLSRVESLEDAATLLARLELADDAGNEAWNDDTPTDAATPLGAAATHTPAATAPALNNDKPTSPLLQQFLDSIAVPASQPILSTPPARKKKMRAVLPSPRRSCRLATKKKVRQISDGTDAIQELLARVCGILAPSASFDDRCIPRSVPAALPPSTPRGVGDQGPGSPRQTGEEDQEGIRQSQGYHRDCSFRCLDKISPVPVTLALRHDVPVALRLVHTSA
jgi:hypothetical protein